MSKEKNELHLTARNITKEQRNTIIETLNNNKETKYKEFDSLYEVGLFSKIESDVHYKMMREKHSDNYFEEACNIFDNVSNNNKDLFDIAFEGMNEILGEEYDDIINQRMNKIL